MTAGTERSKRLLSDISRRHALKIGAAATAVFGFPHILTSRKAGAAETLVVRDQGGIFAKAFDEAFYKPFKAKTGVEVVGSSEAHQPAKVKAMVETKHYIWDVVALNGSAIYKLANENVLEPLNLDGSADFKEIPTQLRTPYGLAAFVYSTTLAYRTDVYDKKAPAPKGWEDFMNPEFYGRRGMYKDPLDTLEVGLLGTGTPPGKLYPMDVDRSLKELSKIKQKVALWWSTGAQLSQYLKTGELDMTPAWNGRAQAAIDDGAPVKLIWDRALYAWDGWCIPKGNPKAEIARQFINFTANAKQQAVWTEFAAYGPSNPGAYKYIDAKRAAVLPTNPEYTKNLVPVDLSWWSANRDSALEKFNAWFLT